MNGQQLTIIDEGGMEANDKIDDQNTDDLDRLDTAYKDALGDDDLYCKIMRQNFMPAV